MKHDKIGSKEPLLPGGLPLMWLIMIGVSMAKLLPLGLDESFVNVLPGWLGGISTSALLAVVTLLTGIPNGRQALAGFSAAIVGAAGILALAATGKFLVLALGSILVILPISKLVYQFVMRRQTQ